MSDDAWGEFVAKEVPRDFFLEFIEGARAAGRQAKAKMKDLSVTERDRSRVTGQIRTAVIESVLLAAARSLGHVSSQRGVISDTEIAMHQAFAEIGRTVVVRASISVPSTAPSRNRSRARLVERLNRAATGTGDLFVPVRDLTGRISVFLLVCPDRRQDDGIGEIAVAILDHHHQDLVYYEVIDKVLARYVPVPAAIDEPALRRKTAAVFQPPEERWPVGAEAKAPK